MSLPGCLFQHIHRILLDRTTPLMLNQSSEFILVDDHIIENNHSASHGYNTLKYGIGCRSHLQGEDRSESMLLH